MEDPATYPSAVQPSLFWRCLLGMALLVLCTSTPATVRQYYFSRIDGATSGLAQNGVHVLFQDAEGFIWISTEGGLNRFNGLALERHIHDPARTDSLPSGLITAMADADNGQVWIGTQTGLILRYDPQSRRVLQTLQGRARDMIGALFLDAQGQLWVGDSESIAVVAPGSSNLSPLYHVRQKRRDFLHASVSGFSQCPDGTIYAATSDGVVALDSKGARLEGNAGVTHDVLCDANNNLFASIDRSVVQVDRNTGQRTPLWTAPEQNHSSPAQLALDPEGALWVAVPGTGLLKMSRDGKRSRLLAHVPGERDSLPASRLTRLLVDQSGLVWVGTNGHGVAHAPSQGSAITRLSDIDPALTPQHPNNVRAIFEDGLGRYWVGTRTTGLLQYLPEEQRFRPANEALREALQRTPEQPVSVHDIAQAAAGSLWLATDHGVVLFDPARNHARRMDLGKPPTQTDRYRKILVNPDGSLWLAGLDSGLLRFRAGRGVVGRYTQADGLPSDFAFALARDQRGRLWIGMLRGLSLYDPTTDSFRNFQEQPNRSDSLAGLRVTDLQLDANGRLWIATDAGINKLLKVDAEGLHVQRFLPANGLPDNTAYCILDDHQGRLWVSSNLGIASVNPDTGHVRTFSPADGLQGMEFNTHACLRDSKGALWFGGLHGLNRIDPARMTPSQYLPPTVITAVQYADTKANLHPGQTLRIPQQARVLHFSFASLDYAQPAANQFRYRMLGVSKRWIHNGNEHDVTYTDLAPGNYRFEVQGSNHDGVFNPTPAHVNITIVPPWWNTSWARIAALLLLGVILGLLVLAFHRRHRARMRHRRQLEEHDRRLRLALWASGDYFWLYDIAGHRLRRVRGAQTGDSAAEQDMSLREWQEHHVHPDDLDLVLAKFQAYIDGATDRLEIEYRLRDEDQQWRWVRCRGQVVEHDAQGQPLRMAGTIHNLEQQRAEQQQKQISDQVIQSMAEAVAVTDLDFRFVSVNRAFTRIVGYAPEEVRGKDTSLLNCDQHSPAMYRQMREMVRSKGHWHGELWQRRKDGGEFLSRMEINAVNSPDGPRNYYVTVMSDITKRKQNEEELLYLANYDALSGLPNRTLLRHHLEQVFELAGRIHSKVAVLFIDLDRFKQVNDSLGHAVGDRMLAAAGARLRTHVRETSMVARLGGDEFSVVMENIQDADQAIAGAETLIHAFDEPLRLDSGQELVTTPSIGIALFPDHGTTPDDLLKFADTAMYQAKSSGRNTWALYTATMEARARQHASLLSALRQALANHEMFVVYQPKLDLDTWRITGVEALLRWRNPGLGQVPPSVFIPLAEETGLISEVGEFVLDESCSMLNQWRQNGVHDVSMAINISSAQLLSPRLHSHITQILERHAISPYSLMLELTESLIMTRTETSLRNLRRLRDLGIRLAIDDFGTGYSSLAYLKRLPVNVLKIDREFVGDITRDPDDEAITTTIISIGHALGLDVVAEGVETLGQVLYLHDKDCDEIQGNWLAMPMAGADCLSLILHHDPADKPKFPATA